MPNHLTRHIQKYVNRKDSVLDLCCGILKVTDKLKCGAFCGVDACFEYVKVARETRKGSDILLCEALKFLEACAADHLTWDAVLCIDGLEHMEEEAAKRTLELMQRSANKVVIVFTPTTLTFNNPHNTWRIKSDSGDLLQKHRCCLPESYLRSQGFMKIYSENPRNIYDGSRYTNNLYVCKK